MQGAQVGAVKAAATSSQQGSSVGREESKDKTSFPAGTQEGFFSAICLGPVISA